MNVHAEIPPFVRDGAPRVRYRAVSPAENPPPKSKVARAFAIATAPLLGSRRLFPRRFDDAFARLQGGKAVRAVIPEHAIRFFGATLRLDLPPATFKERISDWVRGPHGVHWVGVAFLDAADWSATLSPLDRSPVHQEMLEIVAAGDDFRGTPGYRAMAVAARDGRPVKRNGIVLSGPAEIDAYFLYCRDLVESVRRHGVLRRREAGAFRRMRFRHRGARPVLHDSTELDVGVAIAADGAIIRHLGGKHRTATALALGLPTMPVEIRLVHADWLARQVARTGLTPHEALAEGVRTLAAAA